MGSFYTPLDVVERIVDIALADRLSLIGSSTDCPKIIDPACGTGNFLIVAALRLAERLSEVGERFESSIDFIVRYCIFGVDIDETALNHCAENLAALTDGRVAATEIATHLVKRDSLLVPSCGEGMEQAPSLFDEPAAESWETLFPSVFNRELRGFDVVLGNPPFLNQLSAATTLDRSIIDEIRAVHGDAISKLTNPATVFFSVALRIANHNGIVSLIQPISFLATRDGLGIRNVLAKTESVRNIWICTEKIFDADVSVVMVTLDRSVVAESVVVLNGRNAEYVGEIGPIGPDEPTWSRAMTAARGFPSVDVPDTRVLSDICEVASDFRDQYYGLVGHVVDSLQVEGTDMRLATVGLVDPADFGWGRVTTKFAKETFANPVVKVDQLDSKMHKWVESRRKPKVLVATQTRVMECFVDIDGSVLPSVPLVTVFAESHLLFRVAAALTSPVVALVAAQRHLGAGMSADVLKLSGQELMKLPLPTDEYAWEQGAELFRQMQETSEGAVRVRLVKELGEVMNRAYGIEDRSVLDWWLDRLPRALRQE